MHLILGRSGTQYVDMVTKLLSSYCVAPLVQPYCKESNISLTNWPRYLSSSYLIKIWLSTTKMTSSVGKFAYICILKLDNLWNKNISLKIINRVFLLIQTTCLCFKMAQIGKRFSSQYTFIPLIPLSPLCTFCGFNFPLHSACSLNCQPLQPNKVITAEVDEQLRNQMNKPLHRQGEP